MLPIIPGGRTGSAGRKEPILEQWEKLQDGRYQGLVFGRDGYEDGDPITTGTVVNSTATHITTASGTVYRLGTPKKSKVAANPIAGDEPKKGDDVASNGAGGNRKTPKQKPKDDQDPWNGMGLGELGRKNQNPASKVAVPNPPVQNDQIKPTGRRRVSSNPPAPTKASPWPVSNLDDTLIECKQSMYPGDRVKIRSSTPSQGNQGILLYIGPAKFANDRMVCGIRLDQCISGSTHDGKQSGERYFRCEPGHGCYVLQSDVELFHPGTKQNDDRDPPFDLEQRLLDMVGICGAKAHLRSLRNRLEVNRKRACFGVKDERPLHTILIGSLGMDFIEFAQVFAGMLKEASSLMTSKVHTVSRKDLVGTSSEATNKLTDEARSKAQGGVLLVLDTYGILMGGEGSSSKDHYGVLSLSALATSAEKNPNFILVLCIRREGLSSVVQAVPLLSELCPTQLELAEYSLVETTTLLRRAVKDSGFELSPTLTDTHLAEIIGPRLARCPPDKRGVELVKQLVKEAVGRQTDRVFHSKTVSKESLLQLKNVDFEEARTDEILSADKVLARLDQVIGLAAVKKHIRSLLAQLELEQQRRKAGLPTGGRNTTLHMIFSGNPGTGKTTVARIVSEVLQAMGILRSGHCVEVDRSDLVAGYVGQTALKVHEVVSRALGGVLFVDEAYALVSDAKDSFGREALDTLIKLVEDHRDDLVVVLAGYPDEMELLTSHNPGVRSRFPTVIHFEDYTVEELMLIAQNLMEKLQIVTDDEARSILENKCRAISSSKNKKDNGNGRAVRNIVEHAVRQQALRLVEQSQVNGKSPTPEELCLLKAADFSH